MAALAKVPCSIEFDPRAGGAGDAGIAVGVGGDLEAERMGGVDDRFHLGVGEMLAEAAGLLRKDSAGGGDLDDVGAGAGEFADPGGALLRTGAGIVDGERPDHLRAEAGDVAMAADGRDGRSGGNDPRSRDESLGGRAAKREADQRRRAEIADRGEAGEGGDPRVLGADQGRPFVGIDRLVAKVAAGIAGEMDVHVDEAGQDGLAGQVDEPGAGGGRGKPGRDGGDPAVGDGDGRRAGGGPRRVGDEVAGMDDHRLGGGGRGGERLDRLATGSASADPLMEGVLLLRAPALTSKKPGALAPRASFASGRLIRGAYQKKFSITSSTSPV